MQAAPFIVLLLSMGISQYKSRRVVKCAVPKNKEYITEGSKYECGEYSEEDVALRSTFSEKKNELETERYEKIDEEWVNKMNRADERRKESLNKKHCKQRVTPKKVNIKGTSVVGPTVKKSMNVESEEEVKMKLKATKNRSKKELSKKKKSVNKIEKALLKDKKNRKKEKSKRSKTPEEVQDSLNENESVLEEQKVDFEVSYAMPKLPCFTEEDDLGKGVHDQGGNCEIRSNIL